MCTHKGLFYTCHHEYNLINKSTYQETDHKKQQTHTQNTSLDSYIILYIVWANNFKNYVCERKQKLSKNRNPY